MHIYRILLLERKNHSFTNLHINGKKMLAWKLAYLQTCVTRTCTAFNQKKMNKIICLPGYHCICR